MNIAATLRLRRLAMLVMLGLLTCLGGCAVFAYFVANFAPPPEVKKKYDFPTGKTVLVFPDDQVSPISYPPFKKMVATKLSEELEKHKLADKTVPYDRIIELQSTNPDFDRMPVDEVGRKLGADLVIYIQMGDFQLKDTPQDPLWHGRASIFIRVVDVSKGERLWPQTPQEGYALTGVTEVSENSGAGYGLQLTEQLANGLADQAAKLFYTYREERK